MKSSWRMIIWRTIMDLSTMTQTLLIYFKKLQFQRKQFKAHHGIKFYPTTSIKINSNILEPSLMREKNLLKMDIVMTTRNWRMSNLTLLWSSLTWLISLIELSRKLISLSMVGVSNSSREWNNSKLIIKRKQELSGSIKMRSLRRNIKISKIKLMTARMVWVKEILTDNHGLKRRRSFWKLKVLANGLMLDLIYWLLTSWNIYQVYNPN